MLCGSEFLTTKHSGRTHVNLKSLVAALAVLGSLVASPAQAYLSVYAFGDSLSDTGHSLAAPPGTPGGRVTNGPVAVEYMASAMGATLYSYATSGATSGLSNSDYAAGHPFEFTGVQSQVATHLAGSGGAADALGLYVVQGGGNDILNLLPALATAGTDAEVEALVSAAASTLIMNMTDAVATLVGAGAHNFLLPLLPDIGASPAVQDADVSALVFGINQALQSAYVDLFSLPELAPLGLRYTVFDTFAAQQELVANAASNGLTQFSTSCADDVPGCEAHPEQYFFWDPEHPTTRVHELLGAELLAAVVPEPSTLALVGLAALALVARRRRQAVHQG
jgi:phospholipase/lecithinase/hemolysin